jgi:hypothetical protein
MKLTTTSMGPPETVDASNHPGNYENEGSISSTDVAIDAVFTGPAKATNNPVDSDSSDDISVLKSSSTGNLKINAEEIDESIFDDNAHDEMDAMLLFSNENAPKPMPPIIPYTAPRTTRKR